MNEIRIIRDYPYPVTTVWRALTDPALVPRWTSPSRESPAAPAGQILNRACSASSWWTGLTP